ncbi:methionyl-tRNA synthetase [Blattabacterium sp. (Blatta orientalis) str. Tarazona]|uniref:methionine--tRNA ligase n=1 Tax=Blattabacterium sp. (Blatta orientalis) TaxID=367806 RepID=UPI0002AD80BF|nr:methionine--tRNA ligase [Blattabacterium sp. (Blatta orientalis)]AGD98214.1 methionyl-tRNA synthetase [Blattabacterium sp. (Blatta orientalis) str. Tarazona]
MKKSNNKYTVTAAFPYANGPIHIGHLAGVYLPADIFVRYLRRKKKEVIFICGSDEHGVPITIQAKKENTTPKEIVNKYHFMIKDCFENFGIHFDNYSRTSTVIHQKISTSFFKKLHKEKKIFEKVSEQYYDNQAKQFLADRYIYGICPHCKHKEAYGDQCESCGSSLSPEELINPLSTISGSNPVLKKTKHWYFPLNEYQNFLEKWILMDHQKDWKVNVYGQAKSWLDQGLKPRAITRDLDWGIPIPIPKEIGKVLYVWFEATIGYISSTIEWAKRKKKDWKPYWKDQRTKLIQFIGKDNIVFHCIIFPSVLKAYNHGYILPDKILANEFLNLENEKISTSRNWGVWVHEYLMDFPNQQDTLRYILIAKMPEKKDNNFNWKDFQKTNNTELVAILGNFVNRSLTLIQKYNNGIIPPPGIFSITDKSILKKIRKYPENIGDLIESFRFREALICFMDLARLGNKYLTEEEPWNIKKTEQRIETILYVSLQIVGMLAQLAEPFLPYTSKKLLKMLRLEAFFWKKIENVKEFLRPGHVLGKSTLLFHKITDKSVENQLVKLGKVTYEK